MARFSKERLENTMKIQGIKSYKELGDLMGYGENIDIKRFIGDEIPLNVLSNLCNTLKVSRDYLMMESDNDNLKEMHIVPDPEPVARTGGGRLYSYISDPENYECNNLDIDRLKASIDSSKWTSARLNEFIEDDIYRIASGNANSILKSTMINLSWALKQDRYYLTGEADNINSKYICYPKRVKDQHYFIDRNFMRDLTLNYDVNILSDLMNMPVECLLDARQDKIFVTDKIIKKFTNSVISAGFDIDMSNAFVSIDRLNHNNLPVQDTEVLSNKDIEVAELDALSIIKIIDKLDIETMSKIGKYCMAEAERRTILGSLSK